MKSRTKLILFILTAVVVSLPLLQQRLRIFPFKKLAGVEVETTELEDLARALKDAGAPGNIIVHSPAASVFLESDGTIVKRPSVRLPRGFVKDKTGAGDAFCAGVLTGLSRGASSMTSLELASIAAVGALSAEGATSGMKNEKELRKLCLSLSIRS